MSFAAKEEKAIAGKAKKLLILQRGQCDRSARVARAFKELEFRISDLDKRIAISYSAKGR
jgi:hypothetical protein